MIDALKVLWMFWPLWVLLIAIVIFRVLVDDLLPVWIDNWKARRRFLKGESWRSDRDLLYWLRGMHPSEFEDYVADLFRRMGYKADVVGQSHDGGIDVVVEKNGITSFIQCKKFITSTVSVGAVRDFYGALADKLTKGKGYFITTNKFTLEAEYFADDKPIELVDGFRLVDYIRLAEKDAKKFKKLQDEPLTPSK